MWIPAHSGPKDDNIVLAVITAAQALEAASPQTILKELHYSLSEQIQKEGLTNLPSQVRVCTSHGHGSGYKITPIQAHLANQLGLLSEEHSDKHTNMGLTGYTTYSYYRYLDTQKLSAHLLSTSQSELK